MRLGVEARAHKVRRTVGFDQVLFGSDYPSVGGGVVSIESMVAEIRSSKHITENEKEKILGLNAAKLLGLSS